MRSWGNQYLPIPTDWGKVWAKCGHSLALAGRESDRVSSWIAGEWLRQLRGEPSPGLCAPLGAPAGPGQTSSAPTTVMMAVGRSCGAGADFPSPTGSQGLSRPRMRAQSSFPPVGEKKNPAEGESLSGQTVKESWPLPGQDYHGWGSRTAKRPPPCPPMSGARWRSLDAASRSRDRRSRSATALLPAVVRMDAGRLLLAADHRVIRHRGLCCSCRSGDVRRARDVVRPQR